jgi:hypothetical protein
MVGPVASFYQRAGLEPFFDRKDISEAEANKVAERFERDHRLPKSTNVSVDQDGVISMVWRSSEASKLFAEIYPSLCDAGSGFERSILEVTVKIGPAGVSCTAYVFHRINFDQWDRYDVELDPSPILAR